MRSRIDREQLSEFLTRQVRLVERLPVEAAEAAADGYGDGLDDAEREAVWLAAGIATFIGQARRSNEFLRCRRPRLRLLLPAADHPCHERGGRSCFTAVRLPGRDRIRALRMASELVATVDQNLVRFRILCRVTTKATLRPEGAINGACEKTSN